MKLAILGSICFLFCASFISYRILCRDALLFCLLSGYFIIDCSSNHSKWALYTIRYHFHRLESWHRYTAIHKPDYFSSTNTRYPETAQNSLKQQDCLNILAWQPSVFWRGTKNQEKCQSAIWNRSIYFYNILQMLLYLETQLFYYYSYRCNVLLIALCCLSYVNILERDFAAMSSLVTPRIFVLFLKHFVR